MTIAAGIPRTLARKRVLMNATVINADGSYAVRVHDLTGFGARIASERMIPPDEDVIFKRGDLFVAARVAWSDRTGAGLEFYREIPPSRLAGSFHAVFEMAEAAE